MMDVKELLDYGLPLAILILGGLELRSAARSVFSLFRDDLYPSWLQKEQLAIEADLRLASKLDAFSDELSRLACALERRETHNS